MKNLFFFIILIILFSSCNSNKTADSNSDKLTPPLPEKILNLPEKITVGHSVDTVYATLNTKDSVKWGKYQLQFRTSVFAQERIQIIEFGAYMLEDGKWISKSIYDRPFYSEEFEKWYRCPNAFLEFGKSYSDTDNWLRKSNRLDGAILNSLWYYIGLDEKGERVMGYSKITGIMKIKDEGI